jgi:hypothetical protein
MIIPITSKSDDNLRVTRSGVVTLDKDETYALVKVPMNAFILGVWLHKITAFDAAAGGGIDGTLTLGFTGNGEDADVDYFMSDAAIDSDATGIVPHDGGKYFNAAGGYITITRTINDSTVNPVVQLFVAYTVIG